MENLPITTMSVQEARECIEKINSNLINTRSLILDLYERKGWEALGYESWRKCVTSEFKDKQTYLYYQLEAAKTERNISTMVEKGTTPERHLRPLSRLEPPQQKEAWKKAVETAPEGKVTARHVESVVDKIIKKPETVEIDEESDSLFQLKRWWKKATKKDRKQFLTWVESQEGGNHGR